MRQLTSLDAQFLALEHDRQVGHVGGLAVYDPSTAPGGELDCGAMKRLLEERMPALPPLRWRLAEVPFGLDYPYWVDDPDFDLDYHVREIALPKPGTEKQLATQVERIFERPLDRRRPLWELYLIQGLPEGRVATLTKIHHALIDGMSGAEIMGLLLDLGPDGPRIELPARGDRDQRAGAPSGREMAVRGLLGVPKYPLRALRALPSAVPNIDATPFSTLPGSGTVGRVTGRVAKALGVEQVGPSRRRPAAPRTSFNGPISPHRRFAFGKLSLDDVKAIKNAHGATVNDVVVSLCAGTVRHWLLEHDELPAEPLVVQVPVSVRAPDQVGTYGNRILLMDAPLFTNIEDPVERLRETHDALAFMKERHRALPAALLQDANHFIPPALFARASQLTLRLGATRAARPTWNLVISNVPGPQIPLFCAGAKLEAQYPVSVITDGMGLNITVMSYLGCLDFGIVADREQMPDVWCLIEWLGEELEALRPSPAAKRTTAKPRSTRRAPA